MTEKPETTPAEQEKPETTPAEQEEPETTPAEQPTPVPATPAFVAVQKPDAKAVAKPMKVQKWMIKFTPKALESWFKLTFEHMSFVIFWKLGGVKRHIIEV